MKFPVYAAFAVVLAAGSACRAPAPIAAPWSVSALSGDGEVTVSWMPPPRDSGLPTGYVVTSSPGGRTARVNGSTRATVRGLTNGTTYTFTVQATSSGRDEVSSPSNPVTPGPACSGVPILGSIPQQTTGRYGGAQALATGDFNGDGKADLVAVPWEGSNVGILIGDGRGTFTPPLVAPVGSSLNYAIASADMNGDGHLDVVVAHESKVTILLGSPSATLSPAGSNDLGFAMMLPVSTRLLATGDFNGDGKVDVAVGLNLGETLLLLGAGDGNFRTTLPIGAGGGDVTDLETADFNGDGRLDLAWSTAATSDVRVALGNGDGTFMLPLATPVSVVGAGFAVGDMNNDGRLDLVVGTSSSPIFLGAGDGRFTQNTSAVPTGSGVILGDIDGDGKLDAVSVSTHLIVARGRGDGSLSPSRDHSVAAWDAALGDFNGDGKADVAFLSGYDVGVLLSAGDGTLVAGDSYGVGDSPAVIAAADFDQDARVDLAVAVSGNASASSGAVHLLLGTAGSRFEPTTALHAQGSYLSSLQRGDFDGDGQFDLVVGDSSKLVTLVGRAGAFQEVGRYPSVGSLAIGDFNGDALDDIATITFPNDIGVLLGVGDGTFSAGATYQAGNKLEAVVSGDFDGDGRVDLAVADSILGGHVAVLGGVGDGTFTAAVAYSTQSGANPTSLFAIAAGDLDGDGRLDLVTANGNSTNGFFPTSVGVLLGKAGGFQPVVEYAVNDPRSVVLGDFNGDGRLDVATANRAPSSVSLLLGDGTGRLRTSVNYPAPYFASSLTAADLDGDGRLDLAITSFGASDVGVLRSRGCF